MVLAGGIHVPKGTCSSCFKYMMLSHSQMQCDIINCFMIAVVLLIPSSLKVPDEELAAFHKDVGISRTQSIVWPSLDKQDSLKEEHLVHFMLDIVTSIRLVAA